MADLLGVELRWLATGEGPIYREIATVGLTKSPLAPYSLVRRLDIAAAAGGGTIVDKAEVVDFIAFKTDWLTSTIRRRAEDLVVVTGKGDSMLPTIADGDILLVSLPDSTPDDGDIMLLQVEWLALVKRVRFDVNKGFIVYSDNPRYSEQVVSFDEVDAKLKFLGKVVWRGGRV